MPQDLASIRAQYPQYRDLSDQELADALHARYYSDMPVADFYGRIGLQTGGKAVGDPFPKPEVEEPGLVEKLTAPGRYVGARLARGVLEPAAEFLQTASRFDEPFRRIEHGLEERLGIPRSDDPERTAANLRARSELIEEVVPKGESTAAQIGGHILEDVPSLLAAEASLAGVFPKIAKGAGVLKRTGQRALRGGTAGAAFEVAKGETDPAEIARTAAEFAALDPVFGGLGDVIGAGVRAGRRVGSGVGEDIASRLSGSPLAAALTPEQELERELARVARGLEDTPLALPPAPIQVGPAVSELEKGIRFAKEVAEASRADPARQAGREAAERVAEAARLEPKLLPETAGGPVLAGGQTTRGQFEAVRPDAPFPVPGVGQGPKAPTIRETPPLLPERSGGPTILPGETLPEGSIFDAIRPDLPFQTTARDAAQLGGTLLDILRPVARTGTGALVGAPVGAALNPEDRKAGAVAGALTGVGALILGPGVARRAAEVARLAKIKPGSGVVSAPSVPGKGNAFTRVMGRLFRTRGDLPQSVFTLKGTRDGWIGSQETQAQFTMRDFRAATKATYGTTRLGPAQEAEISAALSGDRPISSLPEGMREVVGRMRTEIDALSKKMLDLGVVEGELAAKVDSNLGTYTTRSYRVFDDPAWASRVPEAVRNRAKGLLRAEYAGKTEDEIEALIEALLFRGDDVAGPMALLAEGRLGSQDLSILRKRKDIPPEIRALWGEHTSPMVNYTRSVNQMSRLIGNHQFLGDVRQAGLGSFLFESPQKVGGQFFQARIAAPASKTMEPLNGLYTTPEIARAFQQFDGAPLPDWLRRYLMVNGVVKYAKTVASMMTHVRNTTANAGFAVANGHWRVQNFPNAIKAVAAKLGVSNNATWRANYRRLQELNVVDQSAHAGELRDAIRDASRTGLDELNPARGIVKKGLGVATGLYRAEDDLWKVLAFENELARYSRALPHLPSSQVERRVAEIVTNTYPTYSKVPEVVRMIRRFPALGTFVAFPAEVFRVGFNTIELAMKEMADPALRSIGTERLVGILLAGTGTTGAAIASRQLTGVSKKDDEDIRRFLPSWSENSQLIHMGRKPDGNYRYVDISYTDPYAYLRKPVIAAMRGEDWESSLWDAVTEAAAPFASEEILASRIVDVLRNAQKETGQRVFNPEGTGLRKAAAIASHLWDALEPGTISSMERVWKGIKGKTDLYGRSYDPTAVLTGQREFDPQQAFAFRASDLARRIGDANQILTSVVTRKGEVSDAEIESAFSQAMQSRTRVFEEGAEDIAAALRLGLTTKQVLTALRGGGLSEDNARALYAGVVPAYLPGEATFAGLVNRAISGGVSPEFAGEEIQRRQKTLADLRVRNDAVVNQLNNRN